MESLFIPTEEDFQRWVRNAVKEALGDALRIPKEEKKYDEPLLSRQEITEMLKISMATLTNWQKNGLPFHKKCHRVYFLRSEVLEHIKSHKMGPFKDSHQFSDA